MNNLIVRTDQIDGTVVGIQSATQLVREINMTNGYHVTWLKEYFEGKYNEYFNPMELRAIKGSAWIESREHHLVNYFGTKKIPCAVGLLVRGKGLGKKDLQKARAYYCNEANYRYYEQESQDDIYKSRVPWRAPCLTFQVKFMEEILGFKTPPPETSAMREYQGDWIPLAKAYKRHAPLIGFDNNFQPEAYAAAENKIHYMRNLTIVQKITALHWMCMGDGAFREDLAALADQGAQKKKVKKAKKEKTKKEKKKLKKAPEGQEPKKTIRKKKGQQDDPDKPNDNDKPSSGDKPNDNKPDDKDKPNTGDKDKPSTGDKDKPSSGDSKPDSGSSKPGSSDAGTSTDKPSTGDTGTSTKPDSGTTKPGSSDAGTSPDKPSTGDTTKPGSSDAGVGTDTVKPTTPNKPSTGIIQTPEYVKPGTTKPGSGDAGTSTDTTKPGTSKPDVEDSLKPPPKPDDPEPSKPSTTPNKPSSGIVQTPEYTKPDTGGVVETPDYVKPETETKPSAPTQKPPSGIIQTPEYVKPGTGIVQTPEYTKPDTGGIIQAPEYVKPDFGGIIQTPEYVPPAMAARGPVKRKTRYQENKMPQRDFRRLALAYRCDTLFEMVGGSKCGRLNRKLPMTGIVTRSEFMEASLNQQTLWLYRKLMRDDNDNDDDGATSLFRKHLGKYYRTQRRARPITSLRTLRRGRVTDQTRFLARYAMKLDKRINRNYKLGKRAQTEVKRIKRKMTYDSKKMNSKLKKKVDGITKKLKDGKMKPDTIIKNSGGIFSKYGVIGAMIIASSALVLGTSATATAAVALNKVEDLEKSIKKSIEDSVKPASARLETVEAYVQSLRRLMGADFNLEVYGLGWNGFVNLCVRWININKCGNPDKDTLPPTTIPLDELLGNYNHLYDNVDWADKYIVDYWRQNKPPFNEGFFTVIQDLCEFRNRVEIAFVTLERYFAQNQTQFTDQTGEPVDMSTIFEQLEATRAKQQAVIDDQSRTIENLVMTVEAQAATIEQQQKTIDQHAAALAALQARLDQMEATRTKDSEKTAALTEKVDKLKDTTDRHITSLDTKYLGLREYYYALEARVRVDVEPAIERLGPAVDVLRAKVDDLCAAIGELDVGGDDPSLAIRMREFEDQLSQFNWRLEVAEEGAQKVTDLQNRCNSLQTQISANTSRVGDTNTKLAKVEDNWRLTDAVLRDKSKILDDLNSKVAPVISQNTYIQKLPNIYSLLKSIRNSNGLVTCVVTPACDSNGFLRYTLNSSIGSNDRIIGIVPYDARVSTYANIIVSWTDYSNDGTINIQAQWSDSKKWVSNIQFKIWYTSSSINTMPL